MASLHQLHNHHVTEEREGIASDKVLVDKCFLDLFENIEPYWDDNHVIASKDEYYLLKYKERYFINRQRHIEPDIQKVINEKFYDII